MQTSYCYSPLSFLLVRLIPPTFVPVTRPWKLTWNFSILWRTVSVCILTFVRKSHWPKIKNWSCWKYQPNTLVYDRRPAASQRSLWQQVHISQAGGMQVLILLRGSDSEVRNLGLGTATPAVKYWTLTTTPDPKSDSDSDSRTHCVTYWLCTLGWLERKSKVNKRCTIVYKNCTPAWTT